MKIRIDKLPQPVVAALEFMEAITGHDGKLYASHDDVDKCLEHTTPDWAVLVRAVMINEEKKASTLH
ncbi:MAG: hypothetical protein ABJN62_11390 [Halioglobus sp.]